MQSKPANINGLDILSALLLVALLCTAALFSAMQPSEPQATKPSQSAQKSFATPKEAVEAIILATENFDQPALMAILGPSGDDLVSSEDPVQDKRNAAAFAAKAREKNTPRPAAKRFYSVALAPMNWTPSKSAVVTWMHRRHTLWKNTIMQRSISTRSES